GDDNRWWIGGTTRRLGGCRLLLFLRHVRQSCCGGRRVGIRRRHPLADLDEGLAETVAWYRDHQDWWEPLLGDAR
ncbi:MAG: hypothetical protein HOH27_03825, partial [Acidimicrobiaceae bacterium]|nr:hypothetical protein [Acidimicrobiaceae bacterium]